MKKIILISILLLTLTINVKGQRPIRIGVNYWTGSVMIYLAEEEGIFLQNELNVDILWYDNYEDGIQAFKDGKIDMFQVDLATAAYLVIDGVKWVAPFCPVGNYGFDMLVTRDTINSISQLKGERIALFEGTISHYLFLKLISENELQISDFEIINEKYGDAKKLYEKNDVKLIGTYFLIAPENSSTIYSTKNIDKDFPDFLIINYDFSKTRKEDVKTFMKVWDETVSIYRKFDYKKSREFIKNTLDIDNDRFNKCMHTITPILSVKENKKKYFNQEKRIDDYFLEILDFYIQNVNASDSQKIHYADFRKNIHKFIDYSYINEYDDNEKFIKRIEGFIKDYFLGVFGILISLIGLIIIYLTYIISNKKRKRFKKLLNQINSLLLDHLQILSTHEIIHDKIESLKHSLDTVFYRNKIKGKQYDVLLGKLHELDNYLNKNCGFCEGSRSKIEKIINKENLTAMDFNRLFHLLTFRRFDNCKNCYEKIKPITRKKTVKS